MSVVRQRRLRAARAQTAAAPRSPSRSSAPSTSCRCALSPSARRRCLSGGQQQRVALARAIAFSPDVLLFDEPLSNLDAKLRAEMRVELRELQRRLGVTSVYVTHDQEEALAISDRVIVMNVGGIEQIGTPGGHLQPAENPVRRRFRRLGQSDRRTASTPPRPAPARSISRRRRGEIAGLGVARAARRRKPRRDPHGLYRHGSGNACGSDAKRRQLRRRERSASACSTAISSSTSSIGRAAR